MKAYPETHQQGLITIESIPNEAYSRYVRGNYNPVAITGDFGIQVAEDGRVWVCINGIAVMRFKPLPQKGGKPCSSRATKQKGSVSTSASLKT